MRTVPVSPQTLRPRAFLSMLLSIALFAALFAVLFASPALLHGQSAPVPNAPAPAAALPDAEPPAAVPPAAVLSSSALPDAPAPAPSQAEPQSESAAGNSVDNSAANSTAPDGITADSAATGAAAEPPAQRDDAASWLVASARPSETNSESAYEPAEPGVHIDLDRLFDRMDRPAAVSGYSVVNGQMQATPEHYHWKGLWWESFAFFGVENTQRLFADSYFRVLTADKPFWHDYIASVKQWNWRRWDDGDDILVAWIAHPMQGSVTEFIERQNSPWQRNVRINDGRPYWRATWRSFLWATAYSFDQKLGPLGETALGSEGGYTYTLHCPYPCKYHPGIKVTNNTGDVKLVTTPVVGTLWTMMEDTLDHYISDRVQGDDYTRIFPKILRGGLNPMHSLANLLRWRKPWYRDYQHDAPQVWLTPRTHFLPGDDDIIRAAPHFDFSPHLEAISLPVNTESCSHCKQLLTGFGFEFAGRIATYADLDSDVSYISDASPVMSDRAGGNLVTGTFGLRSGFTNKYFSLKAFLRPGFLSYDHAFQSSPSATNPSPTIGRITHFTTAIGAEGDIPIDRHFAIRAVVANQPVRYREPYKVAPGTGNYPYLTWLSKEDYLTNENWMYQAGPVIRF